MLRYTDGLLKSGLQVESDFVSLALKAGDLSRVPTLQLFYARLVLQGQVGLQVLEAEGLAGLLLLELELFLSEQLLPLVPHQRDVILHSERHQQLHLVSLLQLLQQLLLPHFSHGHAVLELVGLRSLLFGERGHLQLVLLAQMGPELLEFPHHVGFLSL